MFKKTILSYILLTGIFILLTISCDLTGSDCGPFNNANYKITGFDTSLKQVTVSDSTMKSFELKNFENDSIAFSEFAIHMIPNTESYAINSKYKSGISLSETAYACSPPIPSSEDRITDIQIFSSKSYITDFSSSENIAELFDIIVLYHAESYQSTQLTDYLATKPEAPIEIILVPNTPPSTIQSFEFQVKYSQNGLELDEFEFTTNSAVLVN
ncbi:MAG: hypothetical protein ABJI69_09635 [Balneola sp.]